MYKVRILESELLKGLSGLEKEITEFLNRERKAGGVIGDSIKEMRFIFSGGAGFINLEKKVTIIQKTF